MFITKNIGKMGVFLVNLVKPRMGQSLFNVHSFLKLVHQKPFNKILGCIRNECKSITETPRPILKQNTECNISSECLILFGGRISKNVIQLKRYINICTDGLLTLTFSKVSLSFKPKKGLCPESNTYVIIPTAHMSLQGCNYNCDEYLP